MDMRNRGQARLARLMLAILLAAGAFCLRGSAQPAAKAATTCGGCANCQSPRLLPASLPPGGASIVRPGPDDATILYTSGGGNPVPLLRCSQHYHCWIENLQQGCGQPEGPGPATCPSVTPLNTWVEIHTVYAPQLTTGCNGNYESTDCCGGDPKVVRAHHAKVNAGGSPGPVPAYWGRVPGPEPGPVPGPVPVFWWNTAFEWSGSTTSPPTNGCKPAALWSFAQGCTFTVSQGQLALFRHPEAARGRQPANRLSNDLRRITRQ
jgi:hypothetical protein